MEMSETWYPEQNQDRMTGVLANARACLCLQEIGGFGAQRLVGVWL